jgi:hypothetical protein
VWVLKDDAGKIANGGVVRTERERLKHPTGVVRFPLQEVRDRSHSPSLREPTKRGYFVFLKVAEPVSRK